MKKLTISIFLLCFFVACANVVSPKKTSPEEEFKVMVNKPSQEVEKELPKVNHVKTRWIPLTDKEYPGIQISRDPMDSFLFRFENEANKKAFLATYRYYYSDNFLVCCTDQSCWIINHVLSPEEQQILLLHSASVEIIKTFDRNFLKICESK